MDLRLIQVTLLIVMLSHLSESSVEVNSPPQSFLKRPCWLCDVPRCKQCVTSQWTPWSQCSSPCGKKGYQSRSRLVHRPSPCPEGSCQHLPAKEWQPCNRFCHNGGSPARWFCSCPQNYTGDCCETAFTGWSTWGEWSQCNKSCSSGVQERRRRCITSPRTNSSFCGSVCLGSSVQTRECNTNECPGNNVSMQYDPLGCFNDGYPRSLPLFVKSFRGHIDWEDMTKTVRACAEVVHRRGLTIFGIQFYGECWSGVESRKTYDIYGPSQDCWSGVGKKGSNFVYQIKA